MRDKHLDLTQGSIWWRLFLFALPILAASLFQQLYTTVDAVIVGQFSGKTGLAAIDSVYNLLKLPVNFLVGLSAGATIIVSQLIGGKRDGEAADTVHTAVVFAFVGGVLFSALGIATAPACLELMDVPEAIHPMTLCYVRIYFSGLACSMLYNITAGILRAAGDSRTPFCILAAAGVVNVVLDLIFVGGCALGVSGAAAATVFSQLVSAALGLAALLRAGGWNRIALRGMRFHRGPLRRVLRLGLPIGLQSSLYPIANMMIQAGINAMGTDNIAAWALCGKLDFLIWLSADSMAMAVSTFAAQNYGAGRYDRVRAGVRAGLAISLLVVLLLSAVLYVWCEPLGRLFINSSDYGIIPRMGRFMRFMAPLYFLYVFGEILAGAIRGTGETLKPMLLTLAGTCLSRILWIRLVVPRHNEMEAIIASYPVSWIITGVFFLVFYQFHRKNALTR